MKGFLNIIWLTGPFCYCSEYTDTNPRTKILYKKHIIASGALAYLGHMLAINETVRVVLPTWHQFSPPGPPPGGADAPFPLPCGFGYILPLPKMILAVWVPLMTTNYDSLSLNNNKNLQTTWDACDRTGMSHPRNLFLGCHVILMGKRNMVRQNKN